MEKISKGKKIFIAIVVIMTLIITVGGIGGFVKIGLDLRDEDQAIASEYQRYLFDQYAVDDAVRVYLTKEATREFIDYTPKDFSEVGAVAVQIFYPENDEYVKRKVQGLPVDEERNIDIEKYQRPLKITLNKKSKKNVIQVAEILSTRSDVEDVMLLSHSMVAQSVYSDDEYSDTYYDNQWGINNASINKAWGTFNEGETVIVGILDTGIDASHPDLKDKIYYDRSLHRDFTTGEVNGKQIDVPTDQNGHGTHVAGIIGAACNNGVGVAGVAPDVKFVSLRVLDENGEIKDENALANAIRYAEAKGIRLLNYSGYWEDNLDILKSAIYGYNGLLIAAAGNQYRDTDQSSIYPACFELDNIISVGAITEQNERADFSNWGEKSVDIYAPGYGIYSTFPTQICNADHCKYHNSIHINNGYHSMNGTSMATPFVTGATAMMLSLEHNLTDDQILDKLKAIKTGILNGADKIYIHNVNGEKLEVKKLNAYSALREFITYETNVLSNTEIEIIGTYGEKLTEYVELPQTLRGRNVVSIGEGAFENQDELPAIRLPRFLNNIKPKAFSRCTNLRFYIEQGNSFFSPEGGILYTKDKKGIVATGKISNDIVIDDPVDYIDSYAFAGQSNLSSILFKTNANICDYAFADCTGLTEIVYTTHTPPSVWNDVFLNIQPEILVPYTALQAYREAFSQYEDLVYSKAWSVIFIINDELYDSMNVFYGEPMEDLPKPTLTGYDFFAWYDNPDFNGEAYTESDVRQAEKNITLYANWTPKRCTIKFDPGFGTLLGESEFHVDYGKTFRTEITAELVGHVFEGWCDSDGFECITAFGASTIYWNRLEETVLTPKWSKKCFEIKIGNSSVPPVWVGKDGLSNTFGYIDYGTELPGGSLKELFRNSPLSIKEGKIFNRLIRLDEKEINFSVVPDFGENKMQILILPVWTLEKYTVKFTAPNYEKVIEVRYHDYITLPDPKAELGIRGYNFGGWYLEETFVTQVAWETVPDLTPNVVGDGTVTLYGQWNPIRYFIEYDPNGGAYPDGGNGSMPNLIYTYDKELTLADKPFIKTGYVLAGWSTSKKGEVEYACGAKVKNLTTIHRAVVTLYAVWQPARYKIICKNLTSNMTVDFDYYVYGEGISTMPTIQSRDSRTYVYKFYGWYTSVDFKTKVTRIPSTSLGDITIYAKYDYSVERNADNSGYTVTDDGVAKNPNKTIALNLKSLHYNQVKNTTLKKVKIEISLIIREINDGYQHLYLRNGINGSNIWSTKIDHQYGSTNKEYTFEIELDLEQYKDVDTLTMYFDASGAFNDDWYFFCFEFRVILTD